VRSAYSQGTGFALSAIFKNGRRLSIEAVVAQLQAHAWTYVDVNNSPENMPKIGELVVVVYLKKDGTESRPIVAAPFDSLWTMIDGRILRWCRIPADLGTL